MASRVIHNAIARDHARQHVGDVITNNTYVNEPESKGARLLRLLAFDGMNDREKAIANHVGNFGKTFGWIFDDSKGPKGHSFAQWLNSGEGIYWISGLPGSGKSSLVHYMYHRLNSDASLFAQAQPTKVISFFFFRPSVNALSKNIEGLWRSLCYQLIDQYPSLLEHAEADQSVPDFIRGFFLSRNSNINSTNTELKAFFMFLVSSLKSQERLFILIDGLDEFEDEATDHLELINALCGIAATCPGTRICCSSRPEAIFRARFESFPSLQLQDLTLNDMHQYCADRLKNTKATELVNAVVRIAQGVFLWVALVVKDLRAVSTYQTLEELKARIDNYPAGMNNLFKLMLQRCDPHNLKTSKQYLHLLYLSYKYLLNIGLLDLLLTDLEPGFLSTSSLPSVRDHLEKTLADPEAAEGRISSMTAGLISFDRRRVRFDKIDQIPSYMPEHKFALAHDYQANFVHRTALDFLNEDGNDFLRKSNVTDSEAMVMLLRARIWKFTSIRLTAEIPISVDHHDHVASIACNLEDLHCLPAYFMLLDPYFDSLALAYPDFGSEEAELMPILVPSKAPGHANTSHVSIPTISKILALCTAAEYQLHIYAEWKFNRLTDADKVQLQGAFLALVLDYSLSSSLYDMNWDVLSRLFLSCTTLTRLERWHAKLIQGPTREYVQSPLSMLSATALRALVSQPLGEEGDRRGSFDATLINRLLDSNPGFHGTEIMFQTVTDDCRFEVGAAYVNSLSDNIGERGTMHIFKCRFGCLVAHISQRKLEKPDWPVLRGVSPNGINGCLAVSGEIFLDPDTMFSGWIDEETAHMIQKAILAAVNDNIDNLSASEIEKLMAFGWEIKDVLFTAVPSCL